VTKYSEKREHKRFEYETAIAIESMDGGVSSVAKMFNVSEGGAYFESDTLIASGEEIFIWVANSPFAKDKGVYECYHVKTVWRKELKDSLYAYGYGVQQLKPIKHFSESVVVSNYGKQKPEAPPPKKDRDARKHPRKPFVKSIYFGTQNDYYKGLIKNISRGGVFIETSDNFSVGQVIKIVIPGNDFDKFIAIKAEIVRLAVDGIGVKIISVSKRKANLK
jgi:Tfp pilus assembly protein PilZ